MGLIDDIKKDTSKVINKENFKKLDDKAGKIYESTKDKINDFNNSPKTVEVKNKIKSDFNIFKSDVKSASKEIQDKLDK